MTLIPYLFFRKGSRDREVGLVVSAFPNSGFFGIPLISGIFGAEGVFFLTTMITMFNLFVWTYGVIVMSGQRDSFRNTVKKLVSPSLVAIVAGLICFSLGLLLPPLMGISGVYVAEVSAWIADTLLLAAGYRKTLSVLERTGRETTEAGEWRK